MASANIREADENVGEAPTQEPAAPGTKAKPGHPAGVATLDVHPVKVNIGIAVPTCVELRLPSTIIDVVPGVDSKPSQPVVAGKRDNQRSAAHLRHH